MLDKSDKSDKSSGQPPKKPYPGMFSHSESEDKSKSKNKDNRVSKKVPNPISIAQKTHNFVGDLTTKHGKFLVSEKGLRFDAHTTWYLMYIFSRLYDLEQKKTLNHEEALEIGVKMYDFAADSKNTFQDLDKYTKRFDKKLFKLESEEVSELDSKSSDSKSSQGEASPFKRHKNR